MSTPLIVDQPVLDDTGWDEADLHIQCCRKPLFLCGAPYHPEAEATEEHQEEEACPQCVDLRYKMLCPPERPTHAHCPLLGGRPCPRKP